MNKYIKSIAIFSIVVPGIILGAPTVMGLVGFGRFLEERDSRVAAFNAHKARVEEAAKLEKSIIPREAEIRQFKRTVSGDIQARIDAHLADASRAVESDSLERTYRDFPQAESSIGQVTGSPTQKVTLRFLGRFEPMIQSALALEIAAPHLFLEDFKIERGTTSAAMGYTGAHLNFNVNYAAWKE